MNLGEVKLQTLALMYPDAAIRFDDTTSDNIEKAIYELKTDPNFEGLLESSIGSINRALSQIEAKRLSFVKCVDRAYSLCTKTNDGKVVIEPEKDLLYLERLLCHKGEKAYACGYTVVNDKIYTDFVGSAYTLVYYSKIPRVTRMTKDSYELELPNNVCEAIPYFVMWELMGREDRERAELSRKSFFELLDTYEKNLPQCHQCFQIVYSAEW